MKQNTLPSFTFVSRVHGRTLCLPIFWALGLNSPAGQDLSTPHPTHVLQVLPRSSSFLPHPNTHAWGYANWPQG